MTAREIRDHKFKILFMYYFLLNDVEETLFNYFAYYPYESEDDENEYTGNKSSVHKTIHKITMDSKKKVKNVSDEAIEIEITEDENIRNIKQKVRDIVLKTKDIDEKLSKNLDSWDIKRVGKAELTIIRLALYEMYYDVTIDIPIAINEAIELSKVYADDKAVKFVNGVLSTIFKNERNNISNTIE